MWKPPACLLALALAAIVAVTGLVSAGLMAPDRQAAALERFELAHGIAQGQLCGGAGPEHRCHLCHGLPEAPEAGAAGLPAPAALSVAWRQGRDLNRAATARNAAHSPRAPPRAA